MNIKQGDRVVVDNKESILETQWCQGVHKVFKLADGRLILDLDKAIENGTAKVINKPTLPPAAPKKWFSEHEPMPKTGDDLEE